jgi:sugar diacid utilization regulator
VRLEEQIVAHIWIPARLTNLSPLDVRAIEHATVVAALELLRERTASEVEWRMRGSLVADLLSGKDTLPKSTSDRAKRWGHDLSEPHVILVGSAVTGSDISDDGSSLLGTALKLVNRYAANFDPLPVVAIHRGYLVALWPLNSTTDSTDSPDVHIAAGHIRELIEKGISGGIATLAISQRCESPGDYSSAFRVARGGVELARFGSDPNRTVDLDDLGIDSLLLQLDDPRQLLKYANRVLAPLYEYDRARKTELVLTLRTYLRHDLQSSSTARALHIHHNTIAQRLRRIEGLLNVQLNRPADLLDITAALTVDRIGRRLEELE